MFLHLLQVIPTKSAFVLLLCYSELSSKAFCSVHLGSLCICVNFYFLFLHLGGVLVNLADEVVAHGCLVHSVLLNPKLSSVPASPHLIYANANIRNTVMDLDEIIFLLSML